jgi:hypothetical protein
MQVIENMDIIELSDSEIEAVAGGTKNLQAQTGVAG